MFPKSPEFPPFPPRQTSASFSAVSPLISPAYQVGKNSSRELSLSFFPLKLVEVELLSPRNPTGEVWGNIARFWVWYQLRAGESVKFRLPHAQTKPSCSPGFVGSSKIPCKPVPKCNSPTLSLKLANEKILFLLGAEIAASICPQKFKKEILVTLLLLPREEPFANL